MLFNSPLYLSKADRIIEQLNLKPNSHVLDAGCGDGEFLIRVAEHYEIKGVGFDLNGLLIERAQAKASQRIKSGSVIFAVQDAASFSSQNNVYDLIICIGSEFIFGGYEAALQKLKLFLAPDGFLLMGTVFWKQEPTDEYLQLRGVRIPILIMPQPLRKPHNKATFPFIFAVEMMMNGMTLKVQSASVNIWKP